MVTGGTEAGTTNYSYNEVNQLTNYSDDTRSVVLGYDANGNRASRTVTGGGDAGTDTYSYDRENRLVGVVKRGGSGIGTYAYGYDYRTRRIVRDETGAGGAVTKVVFSGGTSMMELDNESTYPSVEYIRGSDYGGGVGGILYTLRGTEASFTHENRRGDVVAKTNVSGALTYQAEYEGSGRVVGKTGSTPDRQGANTKDTDPTGIINEGFRGTTIENGLRVFLQADPAGFVDGPNLYTYVKQNPWTSFDPEGLMDAETVTNQMWGGPVGALYHQTGNFQLAHEATKEGAKAAVVGYVGMAASVPLAAAGPVMFGTGVAARFATAALVGAGSSYVANGTGNKMDGRSFNENGGKAALYGAAFGVAVQGVGELAPMVGQLIQGRSPLKAPLSPPSPSANPAVGSPEQAMLDKARAEFIPNVKLTSEPKFDPTLRGKAGWSTPEEGNHVSKEALDLGYGETVKTILHEEIHQRWNARGVPRPHNEDKIEKTVERYFQKRGWSSTNN